MSTDVERRFAVLVHNRMCITRYGEKWRAVEILDECFVVDRSGHQNDFEFSVFIKEISQF